MKSRIGNISFTPEKAQEMKEKLLELVDAIQVKEGSENS